MTTKKTNMEYISFLQKLLLILLCLISKISSKYYLSEWVNCDSVEYDNSRQMECKLLHYPQAATFVVTESDYDRPFHLQNRFLKFLCMYHKLCSIYMFNVLQKLFVGESSLSGYKIFPENFRVFSTLFLYYLQKTGVLMKYGIENTAYQTVTMEKFPLTSLWAPIISSSLIISGEACYSADTCTFNIHSENMKNLLQNLLHELEDFKLISRIHVYYGYAIPAELRDFFNEQCNLLRSLLKPASTYIHVKCHAQIIPAEEIAWQYPYDLRESVARIAYEETNSDFYFLLDNFKDLSMITPNWLITSLQPLLLGGVYQGLGMTTTIMNHESLRHIQGAILLPILPILQKKHFELNFSISSIYLPEECNTLLLISAYETIGGHEHVTIHYQKVFTKVFNFQYFDDYYELLHANKRMIIKTMIENEKLFHLSKDYFRMLSLKNTDVLVDFFCMISVGCKDAFLIEFTQEFNPSTFIKERRQPVLPFNGAVDIVSDAIALEDVIHMKWNEMIRGAKIISSLSYEQFPRLVPPKKYFYSMNTTFQRNFPISSLHPPSLSKELASISSSRPRVAVITAIFGNYESTCKEFAKQTIPTDFICFTENTGIPSKGWIVDTVPYHLHQLFKEFDELSSDSFEFDAINGVHHNFNPFNLAKYYKLSFHEIPILKDYEMVIWLDGTIRITNSDFISKILSLKQLPSISLPPLEVYQQRLVFTFEHIRNRSLSVEVNAALSISRYSWHNFNNFFQPIQPLQKQYDQYFHHENYTESYWLSLFSSPSSQQNIQLHEQYGMWCTCFIAFDMTKTIELTDPHHVQTTRSNSSTPRLHSIKQQSHQRTSKDFLESWYEQNRVYSTEDQVSFPFVIQQLQIYPFPLPNEPFEIYGSYDYNSLYVKMDHGL